MIRNRIYIIGGGTVNHVRPHLAISAPAYGGTARAIVHLFQADLLTPIGTELRLHTTKMAGGQNQVWERGAPDGITHDPGEPVWDDISPKEAPPALETNGDVAKLIEQIINDPRAKILFMPVALCDFEGYVIDDGFASYSGKNQPRLQSSTNHKLHLIPADKIISRVRAKRKDLYLVGFKSGTWPSQQAQYEAGLKLLKTASCNLVLANDLHNKISMVITPEQSCHTFPGTPEGRDNALFMLCHMALARSKGTFTRSTVVPGESVDWNSDLIPESLRTVVNHCVARGAYRPFLGATVGHFAVKVDDKTFITSKRKTNFNNLAEVGMVRVEATDDDAVVAYGARPSVGGQSQRIIFREHPDVDCIAHFHCPTRDKPRFFDGRYGAGPNVELPVQPQWPNECGSHQCGKNTSDGLKYFEEDGVHAVMLEDHGPNVCFHRDTDPHKVIAFIEKYFDLTDTTSKPKAVP